MRENYEHVIAGVRQDVVIQLKEITNKQVLHQLLPVNIIQFDHRFQWSFVPSLIKKVLRTSLVNTI